MKNRIVNYMNYIDRILAEDEMNVKEIMKHS